MKTYTDILSEALNAKDLKALGAKGAVDKAREVAKKKAEAKDRGMKPDLRKSQLGKWSEGIKKAPKPAAKEDDAPEGLDDLLKDVRKDPTPASKPSAEPEEDDMPAGLDDLLKDVRKDPTPASKPEKDPISFKQPVKKPSMFKPKAPKRAPAPVDPEKKARTSARERREAERHQWSKEDRLKNQEQEAKNLAAAEERAEKMKTRSGRADLARAARRKQQQAKQAYWDAKRPGSRAASVANRLRRKLKLGKKLGDAGNFAKDRLGDATNLAGKALRTANNTRNDVSSFSSGDLAGPR